MSARAVQAVLASRLKPHLKLPAFCIAWHCNEETGQAWMSKGTLARECSTSERNTYRSVEELLTMGVLKCSRKGGGRVTSQYEFDFTALHALDGGTPDAHVRGKGAATVPLGNGTQAAAPLTPTSGHPCRPRHSPLTPTSGEKDERKAKPSLSSKPARDAAAGQSAAGGRPSRTDDAAAVVRLVPPKTNSQQPAIRGNSQQPGARPEWLATAATIIQKGRELGIGAFNEATEPAGQGTAWGRYQLRVMKAAGHIKSRTPRRAAGAP